MNISFRCTSVDDDPFTSCFGCNDQFAFTDKMKEEYDENLIDRQAGEVFQATSQSRRVICRRGPNGRLGCRLRIDRAMQLPGVSYGRALQFLHNEQYLGDQDVAII